MSWDITKYLSSDLTHALENLEWFVDLKKLSHRTYTLSFKDSKIARKYYANLIIYEQVF